MTTTDVRTDTTIDAPGPGDVGYKPKDFRALEFGEWCRINGFHVTHGYQHLSPKALDDLGMRWAVNMAHGLHTEDSVCTHE
jgi:hypothetical protein